MAGDDLKALRCKILAVKDIHAEAGDSEIADLILNGKNAPAMSKNALRMLVKRTVEAGGEDGRKDSVPAGDGEVEITVGVVGRVEL